MAIAPDHVVSTIDDCFVSDFDGFKLIGAPDAERRDRLETSGVDALVALKRHVKLHRSWP